jgi:large subunit ribosomal protein L30
MAKVQVRLVRSTIGAKPGQRATVEALGLRKLNQMKEHTDSPGLRGQIEKVKHLLEVRELQD